MALASPVLIATSGSSENIIPSDRLSKSVIRHIRCRQTACSQTSDTGVRISAGDRVRRPHNPEANSSPVRNVKYAFCPSTDKITVNNIIAIYYCKRRIFVAPTGHPPDTDLLRIRIVPPTQRLRHYQNSIEYKKIGKNVLRISRNADYLRCGRTGNCYQQSGQCTGLPRRCEHRYRILTSSIRQS